MGGGHDDAGDGGMGRRYAEQSKIKAMEEILIKILYKENSRYFPSPAQIFVLVSSVVLLFFTFGDFFLDISLVKTTIRQIINNPLLYLWVVFFTFSINGLLFIITFFVVLLKIILKRSTSLVEIVILLLFIPASLLVLFYRVLTIY